MLDFLGTVGGNILSLPGILGLALGMMTRRLWLGALLGGLVGLAKTFVFAGMSFAGVEPMDLMIAVAVGVIAGSIGTGIRLKGSTV